jgi:hypothetical protein
VKINIHDDGLASALKRLEPSAGKSNGLSAGGMVLLESVAGEVWARATNGMVYTSVRVSGVEAADDFKVAFDRATAFNWLDINGSPAVLTTGQELVLSRDGSRNSVRLPQWDAATWPLNTERPPEGGITLDGREWHRLLKGVVEIVDGKVDEIYMGKASAAFAVSLVLLDTVGGKVRVTGSRKTEHVIRLTGDIDEEADSACLIPAAGVWAVLPLLGEGPVRAAWVTKADGQLRLPVWFSGEGWELTVPQAAGNPLPFDQVFARAVGRRLKVKTADLLTAFRSALLVADDAYDTVSLTASEGNVTVAMANSERGGASVAECEGEWSGEPVKVHLGGRFMTGFLKSVKDKDVQLKLSPDCTIVTLMVPDGRTLLVSQREER